MTATTPEQIDALADRMVRYIAQQPHPRARAVSQAVAANWRALRAQKAATLDFDDTAPRPHWASERRGPATNGKALR